jgi:hypothetical protein
MRERRAMSLLSQHPETNTNPIIKEDLMNTGLPFSPSPERHVTGNLKRNFKNS